MLEKKNLREEIRKKREQLDSYYIEYANASIYEKIISSEIFLKSKSIFTYVSVDTEPDTKKLIEYSLNIGKRVSVPRCIKHSHDMDAIEIMSRDDLEVGYMGIMEPKSHMPIVDREDISLVIVPCISCDTSMRRLGHGAGYYDRFLHGLEATKICLCFEKLMSTSIPTDEYDIDMDMVITEENIYR